MEDVSDPEEGTSWQCVPTSPLEDTECQDGELESMEVEETIPERVRAYRKSATGSPENGGKVSTQRRKKSSPENRARKHAGSENVSPRQAAGHSPLGQEYAEAIESRKTTGHIGLSSQAAETNFGEKEDDEIDSSVSEEDMRQRMRSEVHVPSQRRRRRSRVRFDTSEDRYYTCVSDGEDDITDDSPDGHSGRLTTTADSRKRVSDQGGESPGSRGSGDRKRHPLVSCRKKERRGSREGGESSSESENDGKQRRSHRPSSTRRRGRDLDTECKSAKWSRRSRREVTPQLFSSDEDSSVSRKTEQRKAKPFSGHSRRRLANVKLGRYDGSTCLATFLAKFENCSQYYSWSEEDRLF